MWTIVVISWVLAGILTSTCVCVSVWGENTLSLAVWMSCDVSLTTQRPLTQNFSPVLICRNVFCKDRASGEF